MSQSSTVEQGNGKVGTDSNGNVEAKNRLAALANKAQPGSNGVDGDVQNVPALAPEQPKGHQFRVGWSYDVFLRKNGLAPSESAGAEWKGLSKAASKLQVARMAELTDKGFKTTVKRSAIWNGKAKCYDTALTARVVEPDCTDPDLIRDAYVKAQSRQAKLLSSMRAAAIDQGADIGE